MTIDERWKSDSEFQDGVIEGVRRESKGYSITVEGWSLWVECDFEPMVGDRVRYFGRGVGYSVRGVVLFPKTGGMPLVVRYKTADEETAAQEQESRNQEAKREQEFQTERADRDRRIDALPEIFRKRMFKFQQDGGLAYRRDYEPYELFTVEQAVVIAKALKTEDAIRAFHRMGTWEAQKAAVPNISGDHSGNTFGCACVLALAYVANPEFVVKMHGALTPLVGCEAYGCKHVPSTAPGEQA
jgi:hypothetical protein